MYNRSSKTYSYPYYKIHDFSNYIFIYLFFTSHPIKKSQEMECIPRDMSVK